LLADILIQGRIMPSFAKLRSRHDAPGKLGRQARANHAKRAKDNTLAKRNKRGAYNIVRNPKSIFARFGKS